jgi:hypothetical protein
MYGHTYVPTYTHIYTFLALAFNFLYLNFIGIYIFILPFKFSDKALKRAKEMNKINIASILSNAGRPKLCVPESFTAAPNT